MLVSNLSLLKWNLCESILMNIFCFCQGKSHPTNQRSSECSCQIKPLFWGFFWQVWHVQGCGLFHQFACCLSLLLQFSHLYILEKAKLLTKRSQPINGHFPPTEKCSSFGHPSIHGTWHYLPYGFVNLTDNATLLASRVETFPGTRGIFKTESKQRRIQVTLKSLGKFFSFFLLEWRLWFSDLMIVSSTILGKMDNFSKLVITEKLTSLEYTVLVRSSIIGFTHGPILILHIFRLYRSLIFFSKSWLEGAKYYQFMCKLENQLQPFLFFYPKTDLFAQSAPLIALCWFILNVTFPAGRYLQKLMDW